MVVGGTIYCGFIDCILNCDSLPEGKHEHMHLTGTLGSDVLCLSSI